MKKSRTLKQNPLKLFITLIVLLIVVQPFVIRAQDFDRNGSPKKFIIESISVEGNSKTRQGVILESLPFAPGDSASESQILQAIDILNKTTFFKEVSFTPRAGSEAGFLHLIINVTERYWPMLRFKGGFSEMDSWYLTPVSLHFDNILGFGNYSNIDLTIGDRLTSINFNYINPNIFQSGLDFHLRMSARNHQFIHYVEGNRLKHNVPAGGFLLGFRSREKYFRNFLFAYEPYITTPDTFATIGSTKKKFYNFPREFENAIGDTFRTAAFSIYYNLDKRNETVYPTSGWWTGFRFTQADKQFGGDVSFTRFVLDGRYYKQLYRGIVTALRVKYGYISSSAPFYEKFYLGGPNSLRGYSDRSLSPDGGGNQLYQAAVEIRFPITKVRFPNHFVTGVLFWDSGANLDEDQTLDINRIKSSFGFGFRFRIPFIGLLRLDMAYPINIADRRTHISLGHTF
jgi:outer membrane protein insertion porin family